MNAVNKLSCNESNVLVLATFVVATTANNDISYGIVVTVLSQQVINDYRYMKVSYTRLSIVFHHCYL